MNELLSRSARNILLELLSQCSEGQVLMFKRMYSSDTSKPINEVVDSMVDEKLDWAISQCQRTVEKNRGESF